MTGEIRWTYFEALLVPAQVNPYDTTSGEGWCVQTSKQQMCCSPPWYTLPSKFPFLHLDAIHHESITYHLFLNCSRGGSALGILNNTLMGCMSWYGGCISASSIRVMPADQISACQKNTSTTSVYLRFKFQKGTTLYLMYKCKWWNLAHF